MSTKIHHGYNVPAHLHDFRALSRAIDLAMPEIAVLAETLMARTLIRRAVAILDQRAMTAEEVRYDASPITEATTECMDRVSAVERERRRDPAVDFGCDLVIFPHEESVLAMVFAERREIEQACSAALGLEPFAYWDHTDRPEDVTREQWEARGRTWDKVLAFGSPAQSGFSRTLNETNPIVAAERLAAEFEAACPALEARIETIAFDLGFRRYRQEQMDRTRTADDRNGIVSALRAFRDNPDERARAIQKEVRAQVAARLDPNPGPATLGIQVSAEMRLRP